MGTNNVFRDLLINETRRRLMDEGVPRIKKCLSELTEAEIWYRPNEHSNSVGNLVLHLCGNVGQWICTGLGGRPDRRMRQQEFDERGPLPTAELLSRLDAVMAETGKVLDQLTPEDLIRPVTVQGFDETGISVLVHVVEHFSYHAGQITYFVKWMKNRDMAFYEGQDLDVTGGVNQ